MSRVYGNYLSLGIARYFDQNIERSRASRIRKANRGEIIVIDNVRFKGHLLLYRKSKQIDNIVFVLGYTETRYKRMKSKLSVMKERKR